MSTSIQKPINSFLLRVENDRSFWQYFNLSDTEAMALARQRAQNYLQEAIAVLILNCSPEPGLFEVDYEIGSFVNDLTQVEIYILGSLIFESYLARDIAKLKTQNVNFTPTELRVFDPSNARATFMEMYRSVQEQNKLLMDSYRNTDRLTGAFKTIDFASYDEEE